MQQESCASLRWQGRTCMHTVHVCTICATTLNDCLALLGYSCVRHLYVTDLCPPAFAPGSSLLSGSCRFESRWWRKYLPHPCTEQWRWCAPLGCSCFPAEPRLSRPWRMLGMSPWVMKPTRLPKKKKKQTRRPVVAPNVTACKTAGSSDQVPGTGAHNPGLLCRPQGPYARHQGILSDLR
jgi:hypothetical protein